MIIGIGLAINTNLLQDMANPIKNLVGLEAHL